MKEITNGNQLINSTIREFFIDNQNNFYNIKEVAESCKINRDTATKHLEFLTTQNFLIESDKGNNRIFQLNPEYNGG